MDLFPMGHDVDTCVSLSEVLPFFNSLSILLMMVGGQL